MATKASPTRPSPHTYWQIYLSGFTKMKKKIIFFDQFSLLILPLVVSLPSSHLSNHGQLWATDKKNIQSSLILRIFLLYKLYRISDYLLISEE